MLAVYNPDWLRMENWLFLMVPRLWRKVSYHWNCVYLWMSVPVSYICVLCLSAVSLCWRSVWSQQPFLLKLWFQSVLFTSILIFVRCLFSRGYMFKTSVNLRQSLFWWLPEQIFWLMDPFPTCSHSLSSFPHWALHLPFIISVKPYPLIHFEIRDST